MYISYMFPVMLKKTNREIHSSLTIMVHFIRSPAATSGIGDMCVNLQRSEIESRIIEGVYECV